MFFVVYLNEKEMLRKHFCKTIEQANSEILATCADFSDFLKDENSDYIPSGDTSFFVKETLETMGALYGEKILAVPSAIGATMNEQEFLALAQISSACVSSLICDDWPSSTCDALEAWPEAFFSVNAA